MTCDCWEAFIKRDTVQERRNLRIALDAIKRLPPKADPPEGYSI